jgi:hypothetical protein
MGYNRNNEHTGANLSNLSFDLLASAVERIVAHAGGRSESQGWAEPLNAEIKSDAQGPNRRHARLYRQELPTAL